jgi:hypothetical protein
LNESKSEDRSSLNEINYIKKNTMNDKEVSQ